MSTLFASPRIGPWKTVDVRGTPMETIDVAMGEHGVYSGFYRMPEGAVIRRHRHVGWVQVAIVEGCMEVTGEDGSVRQVEAGGCYYVPPEAIHVERAMVDTTVLVIGTEP